MQNRIYASEERHYRHPSYGELAPNPPYVKSLFLGLGRYSPIFEVHEVDDEVLPLLTLEDLKDMGINAGDARVVQAALHIGEAVEHEVINLQS
ncbi:hypothetical protein L1887_41850 [Cichorium endivia]|nr:hypothetical protein L1887_41850 [Cichorium endivia]